MSPTDAERVIASGAGDGNDSTASDLIPGQYEGGLKVWEGAMDLASVVLQRCRQSTTPASQSDAITRTVTETVSTADGDGANDGAALAGDRSTVEPITSDEAADCEVVGVVGDVVTTGSSILNERGGGEGDECGGVGVSGREGMSSSSIHPASIKRFANSRVLELGCGHGFPGIVALLFGAEVVFHVRSLHTAQCLYFSRNIVSSP